eukprot:1145561-Pelagomonas_calceolata.AAC.12
MHLDLNVLCKAGKRGLCLRKVCLPYKSSTGLLPSTKHAVSQYMDMKQAPSQAPHKHDVCITLHYVTSKKGLQSNRLTASLSGCIHNVVK